MLRKDNFVDGEIYHIYSRGVDKKKIFNNDSDYERFIFLLHLAKIGKAFEFRNFKKQDILNLKIDKPEIEILEWCLMSNHFHILLKQSKNGGISKFMKKVLTGYSMYFNLKNKRTGILFSGRFKSKHVDNDIYLKKIREYIKLNPLEIYLPNWERGLDQDDAQIEHNQVQTLASKHLKNFKYSSYNNFYNL